MNFNRHIIEHNDSNYFDNFIILLCLFVYCRTTCGGGITESGKMKVESEENERYYNNMQ